MESLDLSLAYQAWGEPNVNPVLCLHGWLDNSNSFLPLAHQLNERNFIALDFPGHGYSAHLPSSSIYHITDYVYFVLALVDSFQWDKFTILGHSLGGVIGSFIAAAFPERVDKLVMIDSLGALVAQASETSQRLRHHVETISKLPHKKPTVHASIESAAKVRSKLTSIEYHSALTLAQRGMKPIDGGYAWITDPKLLVPSASRFTEEQICACLADIKCKTLFVEAKDNQLYRDQVFSDRRHHIRHLKHIILPGHHHLHMDCSAEVAPIIQNFLNC